MRTKLGKTLFCGLAFVGAAVASASAQNMVKADVGKIAVDAQMSPNLSSGGKEKSFKPKEWLEAEVELKVPAQNAEQKRSGFIDEITVKWYIAIKNPDGKDTLKLTKDVTHVNVPIDESVFVSVYVSPNTLKRLTGSNRFDKGKIEAIAVEVLIAGTKVGEGNSTSRDKWWNSPALSDMSAKYPLLSKNETPFNTFWWDRYADIKEERR
jgi:hypothetical protein